MKKTRMIVALAVVLLLMSPMLALVMADSEPNNTFETAETMGSGDYSGQVSITDMDDYYAISIPAHKMVTIVVTAEYDSHLEVDLYDQNRSLVDFGYPEDGASSTLSYDPAGSAERVYLDVEFDDYETNNTGRYSITVTISDSDLEDLVNDLTSAVSTMMIVCVVGVLIVIILIVVIIYAILKKKKNNQPPQQPYPQQPYQQYPPQQPPANQQPPQQPPNNNYPPQNP